MTTWWLYFFHLCNIVFLAGRQAVKGCIAVLWLISILHCLFTVNLAAKNGSGMASRMLKWGWTGNLKQTLTWSFDCHSCYITPQVFWLLNILQQRCCKVSRSTGDYCCRQTNEIPQWGRSPSPRESSIIWLCVMFSNNPNTTGGIFYRVHQHCETSRSTVLMTLDKDPEARPLSTEIKLSQ